MVYKVLGLANKVANNTVGDFFVWPAGIIEDDRLSNITNTLGEQQAKLDVNKISRRWMAIYKTFVNNPPKLTNRNKRLKLDLFDVGKEQAALNFLRTFRQTKRNIAQRTEARAREKYPNVMAELRALPNAPLGTLPSQLHDSFPGGTNYLAAIERAYAQARDWNKLRSASRSQPKRPRNSAPLNNNKRPGTKFPKRK